MSSFAFEIISSIVVLFFVLFGSYIFHDRKPIGCKSIPGPRLHIGTRIIMFIQLHFFYTVPEFADYWCNRYGDTTGVWMNGEFTILTCDSEWTQKILSGTNSTNFISRMGNDDGLKAIGMYKKGIIWNNDVSRWVIQKKIFQNGLTSDVRKKAFVVAAESARQEIIRIKDYARDNITSTVDILNVVRHITLAVTLDVTLGIQMDRERSQYLIDCIVGYFKAWEFFLLKPRFIWPLFPSRFFHHRKAVSKLQEEIRRITSTLDQKATPFLSNLYDNGLTTEEIHQCILEMVLAGTDTSSVSIYYTILFLIENVNIQNQLLDSQDDSLLEAVLRESMRLMPVGPVIIRKALADCDILEKNIQAGTNIVLNIARLNRHPKWFDDPLTFSPDRFQKNKSLIELSAPMGLGPKSCVGQHLAMVEMKAILPELITALKFTKINDTGSLIDTETKWDVAQQPVINEILTAFPRKIIVLVGAHSVGKTTLARLITDRTNAVLISETARTVMKRLNINAKIIETDPQKSLEFQGGIIKFQCKREEEQERKHEFAILDRCSLDALVYAKTFCGERWTELLDLPETKKCIERYKGDDNYVIFLIEPHINCLKDDGVRIMPHNYNEWKDFSERYKTLMNEYNIKYHVLEEVDLEKRFSTVFKTLFEI